MASDEKALNHMRREYLRFAAQAAEHGWEISYQKTEEVELGESLTRISVLVRRGDEEIYIFWVDGKLTTVPNYTFLNLKTTLRNASACLSKMANRPTPNRVLKAKRKATRHGLLAEDVDLTTLAKSLPWDPDELEDRELLKALYGRTVIWTNSITGGLEQDHIREGINFDAVKYHARRTSTGRRVISFLGSTGYRSFAVEQLLRVV